MSEWYILGVTIATSEDENLVTRAKNEADARKKCYKYYQKRGVWMGLTIKSVNIY